MSKILAIGDIHGRDIWRTIVNQDEVFDKYIFIGDYFDSFDVPFEEQASNFNKILQFKLAHPDKVVLLIGNHEFHYLWYAKEQYSGYQDLHAMDIREVLKIAIKEGLLQMAHQEDSFLFTHAGVTKTWYMENIFLNTERLPATPNTADEINWVFYDHPEAFRFTPSTPLDTSGDSITQSPIWVRPGALQRDSIEGLTQVVGHTHQKNIDFKTSVDLKTGLIFIDTFDHCREYLLIEDGVATVKTV